MNPSAIYLHVPFCKQACFYCDFHFSTNLKQQNQLVWAMCTEIELQKDYLSNKNLDSIYLGGGTPSILTANELTQIFEQIHRFFSLSPTAEITLEANPDDLSLEKLALFRSVGINRLSIGIQSFNENFLRFMNRSHNAQEAFACIENAHKTGFEALSIDLIYGIRHADHSIWEKDLQIATDFDLPHLSAYCLTIEEKTVFGNWLKKGKIQSTDEDFASEQFLMLTDILQKNNYEHYEISNFAKNGHYAKHNSNYWKKGHYLGIGASAHSYNGTSRQYNVAHNQEYLKKIQSKEIPAQVEILTPKDHLNEYLMLSLRTIWGCELDFLKQTHHYDLMQENNQKIQNYIEQGCLFLEKNTLFLTTKGKLLADQIASDFFVE